MAGSVLDLLPRIVSELESRGIPYAIGGAVALAAHGVPRATADLDFNIFQPEDRLAPVFDALEASGCTVSREDCLKRVRDRGDFAAWCSGYRIDVFVPFHRLHDDVRSRVRRIDWGEGKLAVISAEDLALFKVLFDRPKDWIDIELLFAARRGRMEADYINRWVGEILPAGDVRHARIAELLRRYAR